MRKLQAFGVGTVAEIKFVRPENAKPFLSVMIQLEPRDFGNGRWYRQKVQVRVFSRDMERMAAALTVGRLAHFSGEADAYPEEHGGRIFANVRVVGIVAPVEIHEPTKWKSITDDE